MFLKKCEIARYLMMTTAMVAVASSLALAQKSAPEVLESEIDLGDAVMGEPVPKPVAVAPQAPVVKEIKPEKKSEVVSSEVELPAAGAGKLKEQQIVEIDYLIKQMIEQYESLEEKRTDLDRELRFIRGQRKLDENRLSTITEEMRKVREQTEQVMGLNQRYSQQVTDMRLQMTDQQKQYQLRIKELEDRVEEGGAVAAVEPVALPADTKTTAKADARSKARAEVKKVSVIDKAAVASQENTDLMAMIDSINAEGERLKTDTAKVHYNMGNIYFHKREYKKAVEEYKKAVNLVPSDAAAHFNLAYVSGEYLFDNKTAVQHYSEYLLLNPDAPDTPAVKEKLLQAELSVRVSIDSPIDTPELRQ